MDFLSPLLKAFSREATPVSVVLLLVLMAMGFIFYLRERERREMTKQLIHLGVESAKAALATAQAVETGNREAREEREAINALLLLGREIKTMLEVMQRKR